MRLKMRTAALCGMSFARHRALAFQTLTSRTSRHSHNMSPVAAIGGCAHNSHSCTSTTTAMTTTRLFSAIDTEEEIDPGVVEGTDLQVLKYPHTSLRAPNTEVTEEELADGSIKQIVKEMFLVMYAANGVGLAAPQVGINKKLMVYNESGDSKKWLEAITMVNPKIVEYSEAKDTEQEGCLSFPEMNGDVIRSKWIKVQAQNMRGKKIKKKFKGWEARIFQHEYDHLEGVVYIDHLTEEGRKEVQPRLDELIADYGPDGAH